MAEFGGMIGMLIVPILIVVAIAIALHVIVCINFRKIAAEKGFEEKKYFVFCFFFGIVGYLMVIALPDKKARVRMPAPRPGARGARPPQGRPAQRPAPAPAVEQDEHSAGEETPAAEDPSESED